MSSSKQDVEEIVVGGARLHDTLTQEAVSGSRLGLTPLETPATLDILSAATIQDRGFIQIEEAIDSLPGVTSGGSPADPTGFSMRGFTADQVTVLRNGAYVGPSNMVNRPENTFNLADIEVLKGPASVLYGQGAVGGIINVITKEPKFGDPSFNALASYGSFGTYSIGAGANFQLNEKMAFRIDGSRTASDGWVHNDDPDTNNITAALLWQVSDYVSVKATLDYMHDDLNANYGTPLVPASFATEPLTGVLSSTQGLAIDQRERYQNYNVANAVHYGTYIWPTVIVTWQPADNLTVSNESYAYIAQRRWENAETYTFLGANNGQTDANNNPIPANEIGRDRFHVYHNQHDYSDLLDANLKSELFGLTNNTTVGIDILDIHFLRSRGFPDATYADYVDPFSPQQGVYGNYTGDFPGKLSPTNIQNVAGLFEDALDLTSALKLVVGARYEWLRVDRKNFNSDGSFNQASSFTVNFRPFSYRAGLVYQIMPNVALYSEWTTAVDPPGSNIFLASQSNLQSLTTSRQGEVGSKASLFDGRADLTLALYDIHRSNILTATGPDSVADVGSQHSHGVELSGDVKVDSHISVSANAAYTFARYGQFSPYSGNYVPDVPEITANLAADYRRVLDSPLDVGVTFRHVGDRYGDFANTLKLQPYTLTNIHATYHVTPDVAVTVRIDNLFDKAYAQWVDTNYPSEVILGRPRYFELSVAAKF